MKPTLTEVTSLLSYEKSTGEFTWSVNRRSVKKGDVAGKIDSDGYRVIGLNNKQYKAHRLAWLIENGSWPVNEIDHINGIRLDNRILNLRDVPRKINALNQTQTHKTTTTSGLLGVTWHKPRSTWRSSIRLNGKVKFLGYFKNPEDGHEAYMKAKELRLLNDVPGAKLAHGKRLVCK